MVDANLEIFSCIWIKTSILVLEFLSHLHGERHAKYYHCSTCRTYAKKSSLRSDTDSWSTWLYLHPQHTHNLLHCTPRHEHGEGKQQIDPSHCQTGTARKHLQSKDYSEGRGRLYTISHVDMAGVRIWQSAAKTITEGECEMQDMKIYWRTLACANVTPC